MEPEMFQERENRESPGSCISKCHLRLDFVIWSRESVVLAAPFVEPTRGTSLASSIKNRMENQRRSIGWCFIKRFDDCSPADAADLEHTAKERSMRPSRDGSMTKVDE
jgi:hypothetical protein